MTFARHSFIRACGVSCATLLVSLWLTGTSGAQTVAPNPRAPWLVHGSAVEDYHIVRDSTVVHDGHASVRFVATDVPGGFGGVLTHLPAGPWVGRRVRVSAFLRAAGLEGGGGVLWARADGASPAFSTSQGNPVLGTTDWVPVAITIDVPPGSTELYLGAFSAGQGRLWVADVSLQRDGDVEPVHFGFERATDLVATPRAQIAPGAREGPRVLGTRGLENVIAFTRVLGYVRFFNPAPEALHVNWDEFAVRGMRTAEGAPTTDSLAVVLRTLVAPVAPQVTFYRTGTAPPPPSAPANDAHIVYWQHMGLGTPSGGVAPPSLRQNVYTSARVLLPASSVGKPVPLLGPPAAGVPVPTIPDPAHPLQIALGNGLSMSLPVALYTSEQAVVDSTRISAPRAATERFRVADRATRLAAVAQAWNVMQHFYPYFDVVRTDWPAALRTALMRAAVDRDDAAFYETMERLVAALHDGHGRVNGAATSRATPDVRLAWMEGQVVVAAVGQVAAAAGVRRGDLLLAVEGRAAAAALAAASERVSGATPQWVRAVALMRLLGGPRGTPVVLRLRSGDASPRDVRVARATPIPPAFSLPEKIAELAPGVFYVDLDRISNEDFSAALPRLAAARGIVFDMRGYPNAVSTPAILAHLADTTIHSAHFQIPVFTLPDRVDVGFLDGDWSIAPAAPRFRARIAFLTGGSAISYAESTMGVVEEYRLGEIVGERTAGTNGNVNPFTLPGSYTVTWTGMRVLKRDGTPHHGVGILPTVPVSPTIAGLRAGRDEVLERAVQIVKTPASTP